MSSLLQIKDLSYQHNLKQILQGLNLTIESDRIVGLLGANGAGKSTLMRLIAGSYIEHYGTIQVDGQKTPLDRKSLISFTEQVNLLKTNQRIFEVASYFSKLYPDFDLDNFNHLMTELQLNLDSRINQLSKGNHMKFVIGITLARQAPLYLLDEPFDGIDSMSRKKIISSIIQWKPENATMIISDHHVGDIANLLDEVVLIKNKKVVAHEQADTIRETLGKDIESYYEEFYKEDVDYD